MLYIKYYIWNRIIISYRIKFPQNLVTLITFSLYGLTVKKISWNFMAKFNLFTDDIKFTYQCNKDTIPFLDLKVISSNGKLITSLYSKPTDCHHYLHYGSCYLEHTKRSIVYSQALRIKRVCSQGKDFIEYSLNLRSWFLKRDYPEKIINTETSKVKFNVDNKKLNNRLKKGIPFVVTFHPKLKVLQNIIKKHLCLLYMNDEVKRVFTPKPMVPFTSSRKISSYLVKAKLYPIERTVGSFRCGNNRCEVCKYITEIDTITSSVTGETYKINHRLECNDKCLVYLLTCKNNILVKVLKTFVVDGIITSLKVKVLKEEKSAYKSFYINFLKVKHILSFSMMFQ